MRTVLQNSAEVAHVWAQQVQDNGRSSNMFFEKTTIYSYGHHFPIARFIDSDTVLFTEKSYSVTTAKHKIQARSAVNHKRIIYVNDVMEEDPAANIALMAEKITHTLADASRARTRQDHLIFESCRIAADVRDYAAFYKYRIPAAQRAVLEAADTVSNTHDFTALKEAEKKRRAAVMRENRQNIADWKSGKRRTLPHTVDKVYLRIIQSESLGAQIETSKGAYVPVDQARALYHLIKAGRPVHGVKIGNYETAGYVDGVLTVGCHKIATDEIDRVGALIDNVK